MIKYTTPPGKLQPLAPAVAPEIQPAINIMQGLEWALVCRLTTLTNYYKQSHKDSLRLARRDVDARHLINTLFRVHLSVRHADTQKRLNDICVALCHNKTIGLEMAKKGQ